MYYAYGMRLRGFSPGCQPKKGFVDREDDKLGIYWDILIYNRPLTDEELRDYELDFITSFEGRFLIRSRFYYFI